MLVGLVAVLSLCLVGAALAVALVRPHEALLAETIGLAWLLGAGLYAWVGTVVMVFGLGISLAMGWLIVGTGTAAATAAFTLLRAAVSASSVADESGCWPRA